MSRRVARSGVHSAIRLDPDASTTMQRFLQLPSHVFQLVLAFADGGYVTEPFPARPRLPAELFARLVRADARLAPALGELRRDFDAAVVHFAFQDVDMKRTNQHDARLVARLVGCSDRVRSLQLGLAMAELRSQFEVAKARVFAHAFDEMPIDWDRVLALCPQLVRLDLSEMPLRSTHLPAILRAASRHCRQIKSLVLPEKEWYRRPVGSDFEVVSKALYASLEEWFHANGGLRQLTVPQRTACPEMSATHQSLADEFLLTVAAFCPELEHFDGWKASLREADGTLHCDERIDCSLAAWQVFCRSCPKLREVHWCVFPFVDEYFLTFAATPRPDVRKLALSTKACISRDESPGVEIHQTGCEISSVSKAVAACSGLEELSIILQEEFSDSRTPQLDTVVGDGLLEVVAKHCPRLTRLNILQAESGGGSIPSTDNTGKSITDRGLAALSVLEELRVVQINIGSNCGADGLFALLATSPFVGPVREIDLVIGSYDSDMLSLRSGPQQTTPRATSSKSSVFFHVVLLELLELLVVHHRTLQGRRFRLRLRNGSSLFTDDSGKWQEKLEAIAAQLSVHCPQLNLHIARQGGVSGAMLSQSAHRRGSLSGVTWKRRSSSCLDDATDWGMMAWCAVALTAAVTYTRAS